MNPKYWQLWITVYFTVVNETIVRYKNTDLIKLYDIHSKHFSVVGMFRELQSYVISACKVWRAVQQCSLM